MGDMPIGTSAPLPEAIAEYLAACEAEGQSRATLAWKRAVLRTTPTAWRRAMLVP